MSPATASRRRLIRQLLAGGGVSSQSQIVTHLTSAGFPVTQATVSRDLDAIGAVKVRNGEAARYEIGDSERFAFAGRDEAATRTMTDFVESIASSGNLVVLHTPPGAAHLVAGAIDSAGVPGALGTIAGDDTVLVVAATPTGGKRLAGRLDKMGGG